MFSKGSYLWKSVALAVEVLQLYHWIYHSRCKVEPGCLFQSEPSIEHGDPCEEKTRKLGCRYFCLSQLWPERLFQPVYWNLSDSVHDSIRVYQEQLGCCWSKVSWCTRLFWKRHTLCRISFGFLIWFSFFTPNGFQSCTSPCKCEGIERDANLMQGAYFSSRRNAK